MTYEVFPELIPGFLGRLMQAFPVTALVMALSLALGLALGLLVAAAQLRGGRVLAAVARGWVSFMRGIPALVMIFLVYFALPQLVRALFGVSIGDASKVGFVACALGLVASANMGEMMRSAYLSVPREQTEAALACGMTPAQALVRVTLPQAATAALPVLGNNVVALFKDTSLAFSIGVIDLMGKANVISAASYGAYKLELYVGVAIIYWVACVVLTLAFSALGRAAAHGRRPARG